MASESVEPLLTSTECVCRPLGKGMKMVGRAVTMRFVPQRPDIGLDKPGGMNSPEYEAFEKCGPKEVGLAHGWLHVCMSVLRLTSGLAAGRRCS